MDQGTLQGIGTILAMLAFGGVCWWAFSSHKKKDFEEAANLPFVGEELAAENHINQQKQQEKQNERQEEL